MKKYEEILKDLQNFHHNELFFAFSEDQFKEGIKNISKEKKIYSGIGGSYGTEEAFDAWNNAIEKNKEEVIKNCTPEEVYLYEFANHECGYTHDDSEAVNIVKDYWPMINIKKLRNTKKD